MDKGSLFLASALEELLKLPLNSKNDIDFWYDEAEKLRKELKKQFPKLNYPHEIEHFLADADIRAKVNEVEYRRSQEEMIRGYVISVREGDQ